MIEPITLVLFGIASGGVGFFLGINLGLWHVRRTPGAINVNVDVKQESPSCCPDGFFPDDMGDELDDDDESDHDKRYGTHRN